MMHKQHVKAIDHAFFKRIEADAVARLPGQYLGTGQRIHGHAALAFLVELAEPGPDICQLGRQLRYRRRLERAVQRILPGGIQVVTLRVAVACRCRTIKQVIGVQQQGLG